MIPTYHVKGDVGASYNCFGYVSRMEQLGTRLRAARTAKKLTQAHVAKQFGIDRVNVTQWEGGITRPDAGRFAALADMYGVSLKWLMNGDGPDPLAPSASEPDEAARRETQEIMARLETLGPEDRAYILGRIDERYEARHKKP